METEIDHDALDDALRRCGSSWDAAQTHGLLTSRLSIAGEIGGVSCLRQVLEHTNAADALRAECEQLLNAVFETTHRQLLTALALSDRRAEAVAHYEALAALLQRELNLEPTQPTRELMGRIRAGEMHMVPSARKYANPADSLPLQLTSFVGHERELSEIKRLLEKTRLLTLAGAGGSGKTRLAIQVAAQVAPDYDDGVTFVSLASTKNPARVINAVAQELNVLELPDRSLERTVGRFLVRKHKLLILDNFEHVLEAALLVSRLLHTAGGKP